MNIQIYFSKNNFDVQKAQRFLKERRIPFQLLDLKKHKLGQRELALFAQQVGAKNLVDRENKKVKEHPICYFNQDHFILDALVENPTFLLSPILRSGNNVMLGFDPDTVDDWISKQG